MPDTGSIFYRSLLRPATTIILSFLFFLLAYQACLAQRMQGSRYDFASVSVTSNEIVTPQNKLLGNGNFEPIVSYNEGQAIRRLGRPVGRLDILTTAGSGRCTGFLISSKHLITNYHCVPGIEIKNGKRGQKTKIEFVKFMLGYIEEGRIEPPKIFSVNPKPVDASRELDYAILEVSGDPSASYGFLRISTAKPQENAALWVIGHPLGSALHVSREHCKSAKPALSGGELRHTCDTLYGSSGSPVFDADTREVIALHHAGASLKSINFAIPFARIAKNSALLRKILASQEASPNVYNAVGNPLRQTPFEPGKDDVKAVAAVMQLHLQRIGCYQGQIDGVWGAGSEGAVRRIKRVSLGSPLQSAQNILLLRDLPADTCPKPPPSVTKPKATTRSNSPVVATTTSPVRSTGRTSKCNERAQRYCSNPANSSAIGYAACMTQAKLGCTEQ